MRKNTNVEVRIGNLEGFENVLFNVSFKCIKMSSSAVLCAKNIWDSLLKRKRTLENYIELNAKKEEKAWLLKLLLTHLLKDFKAPNLKFYNVYLSAKTRKLFDMPTTLTKLLEENGIKNETGFEWDFAEQSMEDFEAKLYNELNATRGDYCDMVLEVIGNYFPELGACISIIEEEILNAGICEEGKIIINFENDECKFDFGTVLKEATKSECLVKANVNIESMNYFELTVFFEALQEAECSNVKEIACNDYVYRAN